MFKLTDELLEQWGEEYERKKNDEIYTGVYHQDTFYQYVLNKLRELRYGPVVYS